jgi:hypothetical protein
LKITQESTMVTSQRVLKAKPAPTEAEWQRAARRAIAKGIEVRRVGESRKFFATSASDPGIGYELIVDECGDVHCSCKASEFGNTACIHAAALLMFLGIVDVPTMDSE